MVARDHVHFCIRYATAMASGVPSAEAELPSTLSAMEAAGISGGMRRRTAARAAASLSHRAQLQPAFPFTAMRAFACLYMWLCLFSVAALGLTDYASARVLVENAYAEKVHEMAGAVNLLLGLSRDTAALIAAINTHCA